jgi:hypothetical protein
VDDKLYTASLSQQLGEEGFEGQYRNKCGMTREGGAVFFRKSRFELVANFDIDLKKALAAPDNPFQVLASLVKGF